MSPWEPGPRLLGNLYIIILGTLTTFTWKTWDPCREPWRNLEGTFWEPWGNLEEPWEPWERTLGTLGTLSEPWEPWEPLLEPLLGNLGSLYLGTFTWEPGNLYLGTWEPLLGNLYLGTFTWNLGTLGEWVLELLRSAPKPLLWLKTPKHSAVGEWCSIGFHRSLRTQQIYIGKNQWNAVGQMSQICGTSCNPVLELSHHWGKPITIILRGVAKTSAARNIPIFRGNPGFLLA